jgi:hypothetical protein
VVKLDTASTIALSSETSPPTSFAVSVATLAIWLVTVPIDREAAIGATMVALVPVDLVLLALVMLWIAKWRLVLSSTITVLKKN